MKYFANDIRRLGLLTLLGFGIPGLALSAFLREESLITFLKGQVPLLYQAGLGLGYGLAAGFLAWGIVNLPFIKPTLSTYSNLLSRFEWRRGDVLLVSFCAGAGEELFFRGGLQPLLGVWLSSIFFVAIHGYLNPLNWRISIYGVIMVFIIAGLGFMTEHIGILTAIISHMIIDVILLQKLRGLVA
ncbi:MAG: CPBP family intramembrane metalloprotease [Cyclobacteriaceae bacterium]|nr:CPBP family intramembrane metalloprotease [Cyclobacteriaceae bacterium]